MLVNQFYKRLRDIDTVFDLVKLCVALVVRDIVLAAVAVPQGDVVKVGRAVITVRVTVGLREDA
jgi:hypothetical protein